MQQNGSETGPQRAATPAHAHAWSAPSRSSPNALHRCPASLSANGLPERSADGGGAPRAAIPNALRLGAAERGSSPAARRRPSSEAARECARLERPEGPRDWFDGREREEPEPEFEPKAESGSVPSARREKWEGRESVEP